MAYISSIFQSTHPRGVRPDDHGANQDYRYFNPRTHVGCDSDHRSANTTFSISIHAPTWGATSVARLLLQICRISIHAPTWGATVRREQNIFNKYISIHAPTWGATPVYRKYIVPLKFQSTHPRGVRPQKFQMFQLKNHFNPRTHVGCDIKKIFKLLIILFQSTHPRGVRPSGMEQVPDDLIFQSTHPRGVRH